MENEIIVKEIVLCFKNQYKEEHENNKRFFIKMMSKESLKTITEKDMEDYNYFLESLDSQIKIIINIQNQKVYKG